MTSPLDLAWDELPDTLPIWRMKEIHKRAATHLSSRSNEEQEAIIQKVDLMLSDYFARSREDWIYEAISDKKEILSLVDDGPETYAQLSTLIDSDLPDKVRDQIQFPTRETTTSLEALEAAIEIFLPKAFPIETTTVELLAALAISELQIAEHWYHEDCESIDDLSKQHLLVCASIDAMEIVSRIDFHIEQERRDEAYRFLRESQFQLATMDLKAEVTATYLQQQNDQLQQANRLLMSSETELRSDFAKRAAAARHQETNQSKRKAVADWKTNSAKYSSKAAFARANHRRYSVTERTLNKWISEG